MACKVCVQVIEIIISAAHAYPKLAVGGLQHIHSPSEYTHKLVWLYTNVKGQR